MSSDEKLELLKSSFENLTDEGKEYILAITQALVFAQSTLRNPPFNESGEA